MTIAQVLAVSAPVVVRLMSKPRYVVTSQETVDTPSGLLYYRVFMHDGETGERVPMIWSQRDEDYCETENQKISFVKAFLENGVNALSDMIAHQQQGRL